MSGYHGVIFSSNDSGSYTGQLHPYRLIGPYRLRTVAAKLDYRIKVIDFSDNLNKGEILHFVDTFVNKDTLFLGISTTFMTQNHFNNLLCEEIITRAKERSPRIKIVCGGAYSSQFFHANVDWYIKGYADVAFLALLDFLSGKSLQIKCIPLVVPDKPWIKGQVIDSNKDYPLIDNTDLRTTWLPEDGIQPFEALPLEIARGCIFRCAFCSYPLNGKKKFDYIRSSENLLAEIRSNYEQWGVRHYSFMDDTYNDSEFKMNQMHSALKNLGFPIKFSGYIKPELLVTWPHHVDMLLEMGLEGSAHGIESFNPQTRLAIRKGRELEGALAAIEKLARSGVGTHAFFIAGLPHESIESLNNTQKWLLSNTHIINTASWFGLEIKVLTASGYSSEIDRNPEKYGYRVRRVTNRSLFWENDHMNASQASEIGFRFSNEHLDYGSWGGFYPSMLRSNNVVDVDVVLQKKTPRRAITEKILLASRQKFTDNYFSLQLGLSRKQQRQPSFTQLDAARS